MVQDSGHAFRSQQYALGVERQSEDIMAQRAQGARQAQGAMLEQQRFQVEQTQARSQLAMDELRRARLAQDVQMGMQLNDLDMAMIQRNTAKAQLKLIEAQVERQTAESGSRVMDSMRPEAIAYLQHNLGISPRFAGSRVSFDTATEDERKRAGEYFSTRYERSQSAQLPPGARVLMDRYDAQMGAYDTEGADATKRELDRMFGIQAGSNGSPARAEPEVDQAKVNKAVESMRRVPLRLGTYQDDELKRLASHLYRIAPQKAAYATQERRRRGGEGEPEITEDEWVQGIIRFIGSAESPPNLVLPMLEAAGLPTGPRGR